MDSKVRIKNNYTKTVKKLKTSHRIKFLKPDLKLGDSKIIMYDRTIDKAKEYAQWYNFYVLRTLKVKINVDWSEDRRQKKRYYYHFRRFQIIKK